jgi:L-methionine (R)-S-oxide reductase
VSTCNIKDDSSGNVRPGAKAVDAGAGVAVPVHDELGRVRAVVGIAYRVERTLTQSELAGLASAAERLP